MARLMLSAGIFSALAAALAVRRRGLPSGSPPPALAATVISLIRRVKILPRLASSAPVLCLIVAHFEWPDMRYLCVDFAAGPIRLQKPARLRKFSMFAALNAPQARSAASISRIVSLRRMSLASAPSTITSADLGREL